MGATLSIPSQTSEHSAAGCWEQHSPSHHKHPNILQLGVGSNTLHPITNLRTFCSWVLGATLSIPSQTSKHSAAGCWEQHSPSHHKHPNILQLGVGSNTLHPITNIQTFCSWVLGATLSIPSQTSKHSAAGRWEQHSPSHHKHPNILQLGVGSNTLHPITNIQTFCSWALGATLSIPSQTSKHSAARRWEQHSPSHHKPPNILQLGVGSNTLHPITNLRTFCSWALGATLSIPSQTSEHSAAGRWEQHSPSHHKPPNILQLGVGSNTLHPITNLQTFCSWALGATLSIPSQTSEHSAAGRWEQHSPSHHKHPNILQLGVGSNTLHPITNLRTFCSWALGATLSIPSQTSEHSAAGRWEQHSPSHHKPPNILQLGVGSNTLHPITNLRTFCSWAFGSNTLHPITNLQTFCSWALGATLSIPSQTSEHSAAGRWEQHSPSHHKPPNILQLGVGSNTLHPITNLQTFCSWALGATLSIPSQTSKHSAAGRWEQLSIPSQTSEHSAAGRWEQHSPSHHKPPVCI